MTIHALTLDLDDTLWPVAPVIARAETVTHEWLAVHAPATARTFDVEAMRERRADVARRHPRRAHDLTEMRLLTLRECLRDAGDDPALAVAAFEVFFAERQRVELYADVAPAMDRLAARWPLLALSNGNADLEATGLARWFIGAVSARSAGVAKPDVRIFRQACERLALPAEAVMHVGDDLDLDIGGARAAGMQTAWVRRDGAGAGASGVRPPDAPTSSLRHLEVTDLLVLVERLGA